MINVIDPFPQYILTDQLTIDNGSIKKFCLETYSKFPTTFRSNKGGYQSPYFTFNVIEEHGCLKELFKKINEDIKIFHNKNELYNGLILDSFWVNVNKKGDVHVPHIHFGNIVSGTYYVDVTEDSGDLVFFNCLFQYKNEFSIQPKNNLLTIFPSHFSHYVKPNKTNKKRISISFNYAMKYE